MIPIPNQTYKSKPTKQDLKKCQNQSTIIEFINQISKFIRYYSIKISKDLIKAQQDPETGTAYPKLVFDI